LSLSKLLPPSAAGLDVRSVGRRHVPVVMPENFGSLTPKKYCNAGNRIVLDPFSHGRAAKLAPPDVPSVEDGREIAASRLAVLADAISVFGLTARRLSAKHQRNSAAPDFGDQ